MYSTCFTHHFYFALNYRESETESENKKEPDAEMIAAKQRETLPLEERVEMFKGLLAEKQVCYHRLTARMLDY